MTCLVGLKSGMSMFLLSLSSSDEQPQKIHAANDVNANNRYFFMCLPFGRGQRSTVYGQRCWLAGKDLDLID